MKLVSVCSLVILLVVNGACSQDKGGNDRTVLKETDTEKVKAPSPEQAQSADAVPASDYELKLTPVATLSTDGKKKVKYVGDFTIKGKAHRILYYQLQEIGERDNQPAGNKSLEAFQEAKFSTKMYITTTGTTSVDLKKELEFWKLTIWYLTEDQALPAQTESLELPATNWATPRISVP